MKTAHFRNRNDVADRMYRSLDLVTLYLRTDEDGFRGTNRRSKTHISETRTVQYRWHPWCDRIVFIEETVEKNGRVLFRTQVEETRGASALEIPEWMFESSCREICLTEKPAVDCIALWSLKSLLNSASSHDHAVKEAQRIEGGADAKNAESKAISTGIVSITGENPDVDSAAQPGAAENDTSALALARPALENTSRRSSTRGGRP